MMNKKSPYQTGKLAKRKKKILIIRVVLGIVFLVTFIFGTSFWSNNESLTVSSVIVEGDSFIPKEDLEKIVRENIQGRYLFGYAKNNIVLIPGKSIEKDIMSKYPSVEKVTVGLKNLDTLSASIKEYEPVAKWCKYINDKKCFFINKKGVIFIEEPLVNTYELLTFYDLLEDSPIGSEYVSAEFVNDIVSFNSMINKIDLKIVNVHPKDKEKDLETFILETDHDVDLYIDRSDKMSDVFKNLMTVVDQEAIHKAQFRNIDYIDLRFGNKVIYKLKEWK